MKGRLTDAYNFFSKLTPLKVINYLRLVNSYNTSKKNSKCDHKGMPFSISVEPTTSCNLRCPECPSGLRSFTRPTGMLKTEMFEQLVEELSPTLAYLLIYFQGEPYLHPEFYKLVSLSASKGIYTATSTNAHHLSDDNARKTVESGLDRLIISIDGTTQESFQSYRIGGSLQKVIEGTKRVVYWKKKLKSRTPHIIFQFLVVKPNEHQIRDVKKLARELGVNEVKLKTAQIYDYENGSPLIPENDKYSRYRKNSDGTYSIKNKLGNSCWKMWHSCVITWDGKIVPCCFDKDAQFVLGDVKSKSFKDYWESNTYNQFRQKLIDSRSNIEMCRNCSEGTKVWA